MQRGAEEPQLVRQCWTKGAPMVKKDEDARREMISRLVPRTHVYRDGLACVGP